MKKIYVIKTLLLLCALVVGSGSVWADEEVYYTLDGTNKGTGNTYDSAKEITQNKITWSITGNIEQSPWRIGGKKLSGVDRPVYSETAMKNAISKIELELGEINLTSVNSITLIVASDASFSNVIQTIQESNISKNTTLTFIPSVSEWAIGSFYKFVFNVTQSNGNNKYMEFKSAKFYRNVTSASLSYISVDASQAKTVFIINDSFSSEGIIVTANYEDGTTMDVTDDATVSTPDMISLGTKNVTVTFGEATTTYEIRVKDIPAPKKYKKVTEQSEIAEGYYYLIVYDTHAYAGVSNDIGQKVDITVTGDIINDPVGANPVQLVAADTDGTFYIKDGDYYLKEKDRNNLYITNNINDDGIKWTITTSAITSVTYDEKGLRYNTNSPRFCSYYTGKNNKDVVLYRQFEDVTVTAAKYATYYGDYALDLSKSDITAYTATDKGSYVKLNEITSSKVPAETPVVLYKDDADGSAIKVPVLTEAAAVGSNDLRVSIGEAYSNAFVLSQVNGTVGFYLWDNSVVLNAGKVYLESTSGARGFLPFDDATSIDDVKAETTADNICYDLQGRRVTKAQKGLYIVNGKKVLVK